MTSGTRLVTLTGAAGFGKTRLARVCASRLLSEGGVKVWMCDLSRCRTEEEFYTALSDALGVHTSSAEDLPERCVGFLQGVGPAILIADNLEQAVSVARGVVSHLLTKLAEVTIIATSREALGSTGEVRHPVGPLKGTQADDNMSPAVQLFMQRAAAVAPDLGSDRATLDVLAQLVERLDHNPLAVELAAARTPLMTPEQLLERMNQRFAVLLGESPGGLWNAINDSWQALTSSEQRVLQHLAVFRGGISIDAAEAMVGASSGGATWDSMEVLSGLLRRSLVMTTSSPAMPRVRRLDLYESIREFVLAKLSEDPDQLQACQLAHAEWFLDFVTGAAAAQSPMDTASAELHAERANLLVALEGGLGPDVSSEHYCRFVRELVYLQRYLKAQFSIQVGIGLYRLAMQRRELLPEELSIRLAGCWGANLARGGQHVEAAAVLNGAAAAAAALGDPGLEGIVLRQQAYLMRYFPSGPYRANLERAIELLAVSEHPVDWVYAVHNLALEYMRMGSFERAETLMQDVVGGKQGLAESDLSATVVNLLALLHGARGRWDRCRELLEQALKLAKLERRQLFVCVIQCNLGECDLVGRRYEQAQAQFLESYETAARFGFDRQMALSSGYLASVSHFFGELEAAHGGYSDALRMLSKSWADPLTEGLLHSVRAVADAQQGREAAARQGLEAGRERLEKADDAFVLMAHDVHLLHVQLVLGDLKEEPASKAVTQIVGKAEELAKTAAPPIRLHQVHHAETLFLTSLNQAPAPAAASPSVEPLRIEPNRVVLSDGRIIDLRRRPTARRILALLGRRRVESPGQPVEVSAIFEAGWPGDQVKEPYRSNRVYVTMTRLRGAGLDPYLAHDGEGYLLLPEHPIEVN